MIDYIMYLRANWNIENNCDSNINDYQDHKNLLNKPVIDKLNRFCEIGDNDL